jgi:hypothetical protein
MTSIPARVTKRRHRSSHGLKGPFHKCDRTAFTVVQSRHSLAFTVERKLSALGPTLFEISSLETSLGGKNQQRNLSWNPRW